MIPEVDDWGKEYDDDDDDDGWGGDDDDEYDDEHAAQRQSQDSGGGGESKEPGKEPGKEQGKEGKASAKKKGASDGSSMGPLGRCWSTLPSFLLNRLIFLQKLEEAEEDAHCREMTVSVVTGEAWPPPGMGLPFDGVIDKVRNNLLLLVTHTPL